jgi:hypothetical protein
VPASSARSSAPPFWFLRTPLHRSRSHLHTPAQTISIRGHAQHLYIYGEPTGDPVIVSSGDGGWMHLGPDVAAFLAGHGFYVIGST